MSRVRIAGSINMDVVAVSERHPRPGETVTGRDLHYLPGGKGANQAVAAARAGAPVNMIGRVGDDAFSGQLLAFLGLQGVNLDGVTPTARTPTGTALIVVDRSGDNTIVVVPGANGAVTPDDVANEPIEERDVLVSQFEIPQATVSRFFGAGQDAGALTLLNPSPAMGCPTELLELTDILILNERELAFFTGKSIDPATPTEQIVAIAKGMRVHREQIIVVTLGARGVVAMVDERIVALPGHPVLAIDTTGAGDCFVGNLAAALADRQPLDHAIEIANAAASLSVQRMGAGASMPSIAETRQTIGPSTRIHEPFARGLDEYGTS